MLSIVPVPVLQDNYVWLGHDGVHAFVVDPGEAAPVEMALQSLQLTLAAILVTHHHGDHIGGVAALAEAWHCPVYGPGTIGVVNRPVGEGDTVALAAPAATFQVIAVPGHTLDHIAYYNDSTLFCGDTLFACGCGRLFEGTPAQMQHSLARLAALPADTRVCCTHEYTLANQRFALAVEPHSPALAARHSADQATRAQDRPTLPSSIGMECTTNPFLRWAEPGVVEAALAQGASSPDPVQVFAALRRWKDGFA